MTELNDELLVAYADGQLAKDQSKAVERVLEEDQVAAQRVEALRAANAHLETQFEAMLANEPVPGVSTDISTPDAAKGQRSVRGVLGRAVLFIWVGSGCLLGGAAAGYILHDQILPKEIQFVQLPAPPAPPPPDPIVIRIPPLPVPPATWQDDAARSYALLSRETFTLGTDASSNPDLVAFQLGKALRADFAIPDLSAVNLRFERGQLLQRDGAPLAQISYLPETGAPVVLFVLAGKAKALALEEKKIEGVPVAIWREENLSFLLAGDLPQEKLHALAVTIQAQRLLAQRAAKDAGVKEAAPAAEKPSEPEAAASASTAVKPNQQN